jgi:hypothetical protein
VEEVTMVKVADNTRLVAKLLELTEREFDLRLRMEQLSLLNSTENAEEMARIGSLYAKVKAELDEAQKAERAEQARLETA